MLPAPTAPSEGSAGVRNLVKTREGPDPLSILAHQLRRRFRSNSSLVRGAKPIYQTARPEGSLVLRPVRPVMNPIREPTSRRKPSDVLRPFLGNPLLRPASLTRPLDSPKETPEIREPRRATERFLFRRLLPADPKKNPKVLLTACRRRSDLWSPAALSCRCRLSGEAGTAVPITYSPCTPLPSRKSEKWVLKPVDNGDIGHNRRNLFDRAESLRFGCRSVPCRLLPPSA